MYLDIDAIRSIAHELDYIEYSFNGYESIFVRGDVEIDIHYNSGCIVSKLVHPKKRGPTKLCRENIPDLVMFPLGPRVKV